MIRKKRNKDGQAVFEAAVMVQGRRLYKRFGSYQEGQAWINQVRYHRDGGQVFTGKVTMQALFDNYMKAAVLKDNAPNTMRSARGMFNNYVSPFYEDSNLLNITVPEHKLFMDSLVTKGLGSATHVIGG